jgi:Fe-coproporphyrin III synthase
MSHDEFRGYPGAFGWTIRGISHAQNAGLPVSLHVNLAKPIIDQLPHIFKFIVDHKIENVVFTHIFPSGRGWAEVQPSPDQVRHAIDFIFKATRELNAGNRYIRIFIAGNICDGAYLYKALLEHNDERAERSYQYLINGAEQFGSTGNEAPCISWSGDVHPNQFTLEKILGNIRQEKFSDLMKRVRTVPSPDSVWPNNLRKRCAQCHYVELCLSGSQPAVLSDEDIRADHPKCYLTEAETHY